MIRLYVKVPKEFMCHFLGELLGCAYTICSCGQIIIIIIIIVVVVSYLKPYYCSQIIKVTKEY